jgi:hypothetical protein
VLRGNALLDALRPVYANVGRDYLLQSDWYQQRLEIKQQRESKLWQQHKAYIQQQLTATEQYDLSIRAELSQKLEAAEAKLSEITDPAYLQQLQGTLGADWVRLHSPK